MEERNRLHSKILRKGTLGSIEQDEFCEVIIEILKINGGKARRQIVINQIHSIFNNQFGPADYELLTSQKPPKERWIHNIDWAKRKLVNEGILYKPNESPYGTWVLKK